MKKILVATEKPFAPVAVEGIRKVAEQSGYELILLEKYTAAEELLTAAEQVDALIVRSDKITSAVLDAARNLKIVVRAGAGYDNIDLDAATTRGVVVMNTPGQNSNAVAELALGMMVYQARGHFNGKPGTELKGKKLGVHAFGAVGRIVAKIAQGFGMEIYAYDPFIDAEQIRSAGVNPVSAVEDLYSACQYISLHIPANEQTRKSIGERLLSLMPDDGVLVNTARKEVIDEEGLLRVMESKPGFRYVSDIAPDSALVFEEKYPGRFFFTPKKMGAQTQEANVNAGIAAAQQIIDFIEKGVTRFQVNK
ncbi:MAG: 3-phosphoglycerate dehydrogenase [Bacteroidales bacterium]|nr:3-phosphoglycerate dehydrogenase [Bacteroidales bacterium]